MLCPKPESLASRVQGDPPTPRGGRVGGSRRLNGTLDLHVKLEAELAAFVHKEAAVIFGTGFQDNYASLAALAEKGDALYTN
jgi:7-keto-8-aminopelargonate synthetase-like enzyme